MEIFMENGFFLADYLKDKYLEKGKRVSAKHEKEFKKANREKVIDFLTALGLEKFLNDFKKQTPKGAGYWFFHEEKNFIDSIINVSKADKFKLIRERHYENLSDEDAVALFEFVYEMFVRRGYKSQKLNDRIEGPYNLLNYPVRSITLKIKAIKTELDKAQKFMLHQRNQMLTSPNDNLVWIKYIEAEIQKVMSDGIKIFEKMREIRSDEISDKVAEYFENMTENDHMQVELEEEVSNRAYYIFSENSEVQKLTKRDREIRRVPEELRDVIFNYEPRDDFSQKEIKELLKIKRKLDDYYDMAHKQAISEIASEKGMTEKEVSRVKIIIGDLFMSSEKLLEEAKKECFE